MAHVTGPLGSFSARGKLKGGPVYQVRNGVRLARWQQPQVQANSAAQLARQATWTWLNAYWLHTPGSAQNPWKSQGTKTNLPARQVFLGENAVALKGATVNDAMLFASAKAKGIRVATFAAVGSSDVITCTATPAPLPTGWTIDYAGFVLCFRQDPQSPFINNIVTFNKVGSPYSHAFNVHAHGLEFVCGCYFTSIAPNGQLHYSPSTNVLCTST